MLVSLLPGFGGRLVTVWWVFRGGSTRGACQIRAGCTMLTTHVNSPWCSQGPLSFIRYAQPVGILCWIYLTHWGRVTHICVGNLTIIGSDNGLSPCRRQAIIWTNAGILLIGPLGTNFSEILIAMQTFSFKKTHWKMSSGKRRPFCLGLNVLKNMIIHLHIVSFLQNEMATVIEILPLP